MFISDKNDTKKYRKKYKSRRKANIPNISVRKIYGIRDTGI